MDPDELTAWLRLAGTPGLGRTSVRRLLASLGSPQAVLDADPAVLETIAGAAAASALSQPPASFDERLASTRAWLDAGDAAPRALLPLGDPRYPAALLQTADPPLLLHAEGRLEVLDTPLLAIVGSRNPTAQGLDNARDFARHLAGAGWTIVSGLALGIDAAAHQGALDGGGMTIAVVGTGLDTVYPRRHAALAARIARQGLLLSEYGLGSPSVARHFPERNRIIAGLSRGTLVIEAALQSGSLITARLAAEAGREVFAIPGSIHSPLSRGCHALIRQGAKLVESGQDVLEELTPSFARTTAALPFEAEADPDPQADEDIAGDPLLEAMGHDPVSLDALIARTGVPGHELSARLLELELAGDVARLPGQLFQRRRAG